MKKQLFNAFIFLAILFNTGLSAQELSDYSIRKVVYANELQEQGKLQEAIKQLTDYKARQAYDKAYIQRMLGSLYWQTEQPQKSINMLTLAVDAKVLDEQAQRHTLNMLADILLSHGHYQLAEQRYLSLVSLNNDNPKKLETLWLRIAQCQYQQQGWSALIKSVDKQQRYQNLAKLAAKPLPLQMKLSAQMALKKWKGAINTTIALHELQPKKTIWWRQLTSLYMQTTNYEKALVTLQQQERAGLALSEQQLRLMTQLYAQTGVPYKAAKTAQRLKDATASAQSFAQQAVYWQQAKEWQLALQHWHKAAQLDEKYYRHYALLSIQQREFKGALAAIDKVSKQDASLLLLKAQILNELDDPEHALVVATKAHQLAPSQATTSWIKFLNQIMEHQLASNKSVNYF